MVRARAVSVFAGSLLLSAAAVRAGQPTMNVEPFGLFYPEQTVGTQSFTDAVTIENGPDGSSLSYSVALSAGHTGDFVLSCDGGGLACLSGFVNPGASATVLVAFAPTAGGVRAATLTVTGTDTNNPSEDVVLEGIGVDPIFHNGFEPGDASWSACSGCTDIEPPAAIQDLTAQTGTAIGTVDLTWTAPAEDTSGSNPAHAYQVRFSLEPIVDEQSWSDALEFSNLLVPSAPGELEALTVVDLTPGLVYYFSVRAVDEVANLGPLGPAAFAEAKPSD